MWSFIIFILLQRTEFSRHVVYMGKQKCFRISVDKPIEKRQLGRPRRRFEGNIKVVLEEREFDLWTGFK
jgi:hypothetical protein